MIERHGILCHKCHEFIYSRAAHDYRTCRCNNIAIDGGDEYTRIIFRGDASSFSQHTIQLELTPMDLYNDWNSKTLQQYGIMSEDDMKKCEVTTRKDNSNV